MIYHMVKFGEITNKTLSVNFIKDDVADYKVVGNATYNKGKLSNASGEIRSASDEHVANFNTYGEGEFARINLTDCVAGKMADAAGLAEVTLADLAMQYPEE